MADVLRFVDSVSASATTRLDLNDDTAVLHVREVAWNPPRLRRSVSQNVMRDGGYVGPSSYDLRTLVLSFDVIASDVDTLATHLQSLARELDRETNWLMYQPAGATHPVFFKTYRSDVTGFDDIPAASAFRQLTVELVTDPHALGLEETFTGSFSFAASGMTATCPTIKGDVAAPLRLTVEATSPAWFMLSAVASSSATSPAVLDTNAELGTPAPGLASATTGLGATYYNGDAIRTTSLSTTANWGVAVDIPATLRPGRWRALARGRAASSGTFKVLVFEQNYGQTYGVATSFIDYGVTDHGVWSIPNGNLRELSSSWSVADSEWQVKVTRTSGSGEFDLDALIFVPVEMAEDVATSTLFVKAIIPSLSGTPVVEVDSENEAVSVYSGTTIGPTSAPPTAAGSFPVLVPGYTNTLYFVPQVWAAAWPSPSGSTTYNGYYYPRYTTIRPVGT